MKPEKYKLISISLFVLAALSLSACGGGGGGGDDTPGVTSVSPANGEPNVDKTANVTASFSAGFDDLVTQIPTEFTLGDSSGNTVNGTATFDDTTNVATFTPAMNLGVLKTYTGTLSANITHSGGTAISQYNWSFTTREGAWGTDENIENDGFSDFSDPQVARSNNGDGMAIWMSISGSTFMVHYNKYTGSSGTWGAFQMLESYTNNPVTDLRVDMDNNGNAMAVWSVDPPGGGNFDLVASYYNGTLWDALPTKFDAGTGVASDPQFAFDGSGNAIAVWIQDSSVYANRYTGTWGTAVPIDADGVAIADPSVTPQLAMFDNGNAIAVWAQEDSVSAGVYIIYASHYDVGSGNWSATPIPLGNTATGSIPQIAIGNGGDAIAVWLQGTDPYSTYAAVYDGSTWGLPEELDNDAHISTTPKVGVDAQGNGIALWRAAPTGAADRLEYKLFDGSNWGTVGNVDNGVSDAFEPQLVMDEEGHAIVVWRQDTDDMTSVSSIWANRYRSGSGWGTATLLETNDDDPAGVSSPNLGMDKNGNAFAIWLQDQDATTVNSVWTAGFE